MNYIWEYFEKAKEAGIQEENIKFVPAKIYSTYMELSLEALNMEFSKGKIQEIEINPFYRFGHIFRRMFEPDDIENIEIKKELFDWFFQYIVRVDQYKDFNLQEFYKEFLLEELKRGCFGEFLSKEIMEFSESEQEVLVNQLAILYQTQQMIPCFIQALHGIFPDSYMYLLQEKEEILIYVGVKKKECYEKKMQAILELFQPFEYKVRLYYDKHFGIMEKEETMAIESIVLY